MKFFFKLLSTVCFLGYIPFGPGTFGSIFGFFLFFFLFRRTGDFYLLLILIFFLAGVYISDFAEKQIFKLKDPREIVIDEVVGILVSYSNLPIWEGRYCLIKLLTGFLFFRIFDILKPHPIRSVQKLDGGLGIMLDDVIAGIYTSVLCGLVFKLFKL